jgi:hypothetical protein
VLPSLRKRVTAALCPTHIAVSISSRGWRPVSTKPACYAAERVEGVANWEAPLAALRQWLEQTQQEDVDVDILLADDFVRYALIPWSDQVQKPAERAALAQITFESLFGAAALDWEIRVDAGDFDQASIACALDRVFLTELQSVLMARKLRLRSLQPNFMRLCAHWRPPVEGDALLALVGGDQCLLATVRNAGWNSIRAVKLTDDPRQAAPAVIEREILLQGLSEQTEVCVHAPDSLASSSFQAAIRVTTLPLSAGSEGQPAAAAMLMAGAA